MCGRAPRSSHPASASSSAAYPRHQQTWRNSESLSPGGESEWRPRVTLDGFRPADWYGRDFRGARHVRRQGSADECRASTVYRGSGRGLLAAVRGVGPGAEQLRGCTHDDTGACGTSPVPSCPGAVGRQHSRILGRWGPANANCPARRLPLSAGSAWPLRVSAAQGGLAVA